MEKMKKIWAWIKSAPTKVWAWMKRLWTKVQKFWYFKIANPVVAKGEKGGFKWVFRRYYLDISTVSGNWRMRITASAHPYGYLLYGVQAGDDSNIHGFAATLYMQAMMLTKEQRLVNDIQSALRRYDKRVEAEGKKAEREDDEIALKEVQQEQEYIERRKYRRAKNAAKN